MNCAVLHFLLEETRSWRGIEAVILHEKLTSLLKNSLSRDFMYLCIFLRQKEREKQVRGKFMRVSSTKIYSLWV